MNCSDDILNEPDLNKKVRRNRIPSKTRGVNFDARKVD